MIKARVKIPEWKWTVYIYFAVDEYYVTEIIAAMRKLGATRRELLHAYENMANNHLNAGLTFTNVRERKSVLVVGFTTTPAEFSNSLTHEIAHLANHIGQRYDIDPNGEEHCYLSGDIAKRLFPYAKHLLCEHCRKEWSFSHKRK